MRTDTLPRQGHTPAVDASPQASSASLIRTTLDRANPVPLYAQLIDEMRRLIGAGTWTAKSRIPSERELCAMFHVSRITVRQALQLLVREGLLVQTSGRGTYLADQVSSAMGSMNPIATSGHLLKHGTHPGGWRFKPSPSPVPTHVLSDLGVEDGGALTCLSRWRQPDVRETVYLSNDRCPGLRTYHKNDVPLYETLLRYYGIVPERATLQWYSPWASNAVTDSSSPGNREPVLRIQQTTFGRDGRAFEHVEIHRVQRVGAEPTHSSDREGRSL
jgi:GntR family transcriptional regulator